MNNKSLIELNKRDFDKCLFCLYCLPIDIYMALDDGKIDTQTVFIFYGCNLLGKRRYLSSIIVSHDFPTSSWYEFFQSFKTRGLQQIIYAVLPNNKHLKDALKLAFLDVESIISIFDTIMKISKYFSTSYSSSLLTFIKNVYLGSDLSDYEANLNIFKETYNSPFILDIVNDNLIKAKDYYNIPQHVRKNIFSYYFLRDNLKKLLVISHSKHFFSSLDDFIESCLPIFQVFETKMYCPKSEWLELLNTLYITKKDLLKPFL